MFTNKIRIAIMALAGAAALVLPASALAQNPLEWALAGSSEQPYDFNTYTLGDVHRPLSCRSVTIGCWQDLVYGNQTWGVDLKWNNPAFDSVGNPLHERNVQWKFVRQGNPSFPASYPASCHQISGTEQVAIYDTVNRQYLAYGHYAAGVELVWASTPSYEWKVAVGLLEQSTYSDRVAQLYDSTAGAYLVRSHQTWGVDLGWLHAPYGLPNAYNAPAPCRATPTEEPPTMLP
ncbi:MAG: hypothetical protein M3Z95_07780 [Actinomycetota bacterium]|nr:hypothetical protein [Actinomycetota bacterium]